MLEELGRMRGVAVRPAGLHLPSTANSTNVETSTDAPSGTFDQSGRRPNKG